MWMMAQQHTQEDMWAVQKYLAQSITAQMWAISQLEVLLNAEKATWARAAKRLISAAYLRLFRSILSLC